MAEVRYIISDASKQLDVESHVLRYWEEELELDIPRNELGHRYYREEDITLLKNVKLLKDQGLQLKAIKMILPSMLEEDKLPAGYAKKEEEVPVDISQTGNNKIKQFQEFMRCVLEDTLKENNKELKNELKKEVGGEIRHIFKEREHLEERRYKKLDETIREMQKMRQEMAASSSRKLFRFKK